MSRAGKSTIDTVAEFKRVHQEARARGPGFAVNTPIRLEGVAILFPVRFEGTQFTEEVAFRGCRFKYPVRFEDCTFEERTSFYTCQFEFSFVLIGSLFGKNLQSAPIVIDTYMDAYQLEAPLLKSFHDFRGLRVSGDLRFREVTSTSSINLMRSHVGGTLDAMGLEIDAGSLWMDQVEVRKSLNLQAMPKPEREERKARRAVGAGAGAGSDDATAASWEQAKPRRTRVAHAVLVNHATVSGPLWARGLKTEHFVGGASTFAEMHFDSRAPAKTGETEIEGWLWLSGSTIGHVVDISCARIRTADFYCTTIGTSLLAEMDGEKDSELRRTTITSDLMLQSAKVGGNVLLCGIHACRIYVFQTSCTALVLEATTDKTRFAPGQTLRPHVCKTLTVAQCDIANDLVINRRAADMLADPPRPRPQDVRDAEPVVLARFGGVDLSSTKIGGDLRVAEVHSANLKATNITVDGDTTLEASKFDSVDLEDGEFGGELRVLAMRVSGNFSLNNARVRGSLFPLPEPSEPHASRRLVFPQVGGELRLEGAELSELFVRFKGTHAPRGARPELEPTKIAISRARIGALHMAGRIPGRAIIEAREVDLDDLDLHDVLPGESDFSRRDVIRAGVQGFLLVALAWLAGRHISRPEFGWGSASIIFAAYVLLLIVPALVWLLGPRGPTKKLKQTRVWARGLLRRRSRKWSRRLFRRWARERRLSRFLKERQHVLAFLHSTRFSRDLYVKLEENHRSRGHDLLADEIFLARRKRESGLENIRDATGERPRDEPYPPSHAEWFWRQFLNLTIGFGVRTHRLLYLWLAVSFATFAIFSEARSVSRAPAVVQHATTQPSNKKDTPRPQYAESEHPGEWTLSDAAFMTLRLQIPIVDLATREDWAPSDEPITQYPCMWLQFESYAALVQLFSWISVPLWIAGASGLLKKVQ